jgi:hypothetical protein
MCIGGRHAAISIARAIFREGQPAFWRWNVQDQWYRRRRRIKGTVIGALALFLPAAAWGGGVSDPWADSVVNYVQGSNVNTSYVDPSTALGAPERFTGETDFGGTFAAAVTMFSPAFGTDELVSIGEGGSLEVHFAEPILNDPANLFGVDFMIFGNEGFIDAAFPNGVISDPAGLFTPDPMEVQVSENGVSWVSLGTFIEGLFPTQGYLDVPAQSPTPGSAPTNFQKPINPSLALSSFDGLTYSQALDLYDGSGGGTPIDIGPSGLSEVSFVRILNNTVGVTVEIESFATVPEPSGGLLMLFGLVGAALWRES